MSIYFLDVIELAQHAYELKAEQSRKQTFDLNPICLPAPSEPHFVLDEETQMQIHSFGKQPKVPVLLKLNTENIQEIH